MTEDRGPKTVDLIPELACVDTGIRHTEALRHREPCGFCLGVSEPRCVVIVNSSEVTYRFSDDRGVALIIALLAMMLLSALAMALSLTTSTESRISATYGSGTEAFYAADAGLERAVQELSLVPDWDQVLNGTVTSAFIDGPPGPRALSNGSMLDLVQTTALVSCGKTACSDVDLDASTSERPWGRNNPRWQLYAHGQLADMSPSGTINSNVYVVVWVADDPLENDGQPLVDGDNTAGANPGRGLVQVLAQAYGPSGTSRLVEATLRRAVPRVRVLSWREIRE